jgi:hypothetical protein
MEDCVILFLHHNNDEITRFHLNQFKIHNPYFKIVPINPSSYPKSKLWSYNNMWMHNDTMIYDWMDSKDFVPAKRYCWFDWDTLCEQSIDEYYGEHWDSDFAGTHVYNIQNHSYWQWFQHAKKYKNLSKYHNELRGVAPFCGTIVSKDAFQISVERLKKENFEWIDQMNELRLATCANLEGVTLSAIKRNSIQPFASDIGNSGKIQHPIKIKRTNMIDQKLNRFQDIVIVSPAFSASKEIVRDLNASREIYKGWDINFIGLGNPMKSYIDAKVLAVKTFAEINNNMFEWLLVLDSNDTLVIRDFDVNLKNVLDSFQKPIIFSGETNCYPLKELRGLYTSESLTKYLNSGVIAIKKDFVDKLFNHILFLYENFKEYSSVGYNSPNDQTYYSLVLFSKELRDFIAIDEQGLISVSTLGIPDNHFKFNDGLTYNNSRPYILHCQGNDKHGRKRDFMRKLNIPVRG